MATYLALNLGFLIVALVSVWWPRRRYPVAWRPLVLGLSVMLTLTAIFDTLIISSGIVAYHEETLLGAYVGSAPIEDFCYTIAAAILLPHVWERIRKE